MFDFVYELLQKIGYHHPIHPTEVHMPIGLVVGAFVFCLAGMKLRRPELGRTAHYCMVLALVWFFPTVIFGLMDWHKYYGGSWLHPIEMKLILSAVLAVFLTGAVLVGRKATAPRSTLGLYLLCFLTVVGLGYYGGELVLGGRSPVVPDAFREAGALFDGHCAACHLGGVAIETPDLPLRSSPKLSRFDTFLAQLRSPRRADGSPSDMPVFPHEAISDEEAWQMYQYIVHILGCACPEK